jgi:anti-sigma B factor antagonist
MQNLVTFRQKSAVIQPCGSLCAANATKFQDQLNAAVLSDEHSCLLVDLAMVDFIDSAGLMVLVSAHKIATSLNKRFSLCSLSQSTRMVLELTQLDQVFEILEAHTYIQELAA